MESLLGEALRAGTGSADTKSVLGSCKTLGFYFSAGWCGPCRAFTPSLKAVYEAKRERGDGLEIVFLSWDKSDREFEQYYGGMPWKAVPFSRASEVSKRLPALLKTAPVKSIPTLLLVDPKSGVLITRDGRAQIRAYQQELAASGDTRQLTSDPSVALLVKGITVTVYSLDEIKGVIQRPALLRYDVSTGGAQGRFIWTGTGSEADKFSKKVDGSMPLTDLEGLSLGKTGLVLKAPAGGGARSDQCFMLSSGAKSFTAHAKTAEECAAVVSAIHHVLSCGKDRVAPDRKLASNGSVKNPVVGLRIIRWTPELEALEKKRRELTEAGPPAVDKKALLKNKSVKAVSKGLDIVGFSLDEMGKPKAKKMCIVYKKEPGRLGSLLWCDRRKRRRPPKDSPSIDLDTLSLVTLGKQSRTLQSGAATMAEAEACMGLISPVAQVALEMEEGEAEVELLIDALQVIFKASQDKVMERKQKGHGKFQVTRYEIVRLEDKLQRQIADADEDEDGDGGGAGINVDTNWQVPLGFEGGAYAGGGG